MRTGELTHRIIIEYVSGSIQNDYGEQDENIEVFAKRKAKKRNISTYETEALGVVVLQNRIEFEFRYLKGLDSSMWVIYDGDKFDIISLYHYARNRYTKITVEKHAR